MKADRNKTIDMTVEEGEEYPDRYLRISDKKTLEEVLDKNFYGKKFKKISDEMYEEYTERRMPLVSPAFDWENDDQGDEAGSRIRDKVRA